MKKRIVIFSLCVLFLLSRIALGVPANPAPFTLIQPDNAIFDARQVGDERNAHFETLDGFTIIKDANRWWTFAGKDKNGKLVPTAYIVGSAEPVKLGIPKHLHQDVMERMPLASEEKIKMSTTLQHSSVEYSLPQNKTEKAQSIGETLGKKAIEKGIKSVVFDKGGFSYHGRVKAVADGLRKAGVKF